MKEKEINAYAGPRMLDNFSKILLFGTKSVFLLP